jgi:hypothetical protein
MHTDGTRYFFLSMVGISVLSAFSQMTWKHRRGYMLSNMAIEAWTKICAHRNTIWVLLANTLSFTLALVCRNMNRVV